MPNTKPKEKRIDEIRRLCHESGIPMAELFREAKVPNGTIANWDRKEPDAFEKYDRLKDTLEDLKKAKSGQPQAETTE